MLLDHLPNRGPLMPEQYARAYEQSRAEPEVRIRRIAKQHGVQPVRVKGALRKHWGSERYRKELGIHRHSPEALVALMNEPKIQNADDVPGAAARALGVKRQSLMSILSRKKIIRTAKGYIHMPKGRKRFGDGLTPEQVGLVKKAKSLLSQGLEMRQGGQAFKQGQKLAVVKAHKSGIPVSWLAKELRLNPLTIRSWVHKTPIGRQ